MQIEDIYDLLDIEKFKGVSEDLNPLIIQIVNMRYWMMIDRPRIYSSESSVFSPVDVLKDP